MASKIGGESSRRFKVLMPKGEERAIARMVGREGDRIAARMQADDVASVVAKEFEKQGELIGATAPVRADSRSWVDVVSETARGRAIWD